MIETSSKSGDCFYILDDETTTTAPVIAYGETNAACSTPSTVPAAQSSVTSGNAGAHIGATVAWYTSW